MEVVYTHFIEEEAEAQREQVTCFRPYSWSVAELRFNPGPSDAELSALLPSPGDRKGPLSANTCLLCSSLQVYIIRVTWSSGSTEAIYRRYSKFFDLQVRAWGLQ